MKTEFELECSQKNISPMIAKIIGAKPQHRPYVSICMGDAFETFFIPDKDLELFAVNILKALKSKHLKSK